MPPSEVLPPVSRTKYWTRRGVAEWLLAEIRTGRRNIVGIDHGFSFPLSYFERYGIERNWPKFLDDFCDHWPADVENVSVQSIREGECGNGSLRLGSSRWRRLTERRAGTAKSVFHFDVQGSVAKSTFSGLPWLRWLRLEAGELIHFWPFDGWRPDDTKTVIAEVYPALWSKSLPIDNRSSDQQDAYAIAAWLLKADEEGTLSQYFRPTLSEAESVSASIEGWILGVG